MLVFSVTEHFLLVWLFNGPTPARTRHPTNWQLLTSETDFVVILTSHEWTLQIYFTKNKNNTETCRFSSKVWEYFKFKMTFHLPHINRSYKNYFRDILNQQLIIIGTDVWTPSCSTHITVKIPIHWQLFLYVLCLRSLLRTNHETLKTLLRTNNETLTDHLWSVDQWFKY